MTAHREKPTITPERIDWFARFHAKHGAWGYTFHVVLDDGNWRLNCTADERDWHDSAELHDAVAFLNSLTPSQRKRLGEKAELRMYDAGYKSWPPSGPFGKLTVTKIDAAAGVITVESKR